MDSVKLQGGMVAMLQEDAPIEFREVTLRYGERVLFDRWSLRVGRGERVLVRGVSGSGKTSLLRMLLGFQAADSGAILFEGRALSADAVWALRRKVAYVAQSPRFGENTVREAFEAIAAFGANAHLARGKAHFCECLEWIGLPSAILEKRTADVSGGERQRVALAIARMLERKIFLLDEPTASLDDAAKRLVRDQFLGLPDECTLVVVTHDDAWSGGVRAMREVVVGGEGSGK